MKNIWCALFLVSFLNLSLSTKAAEERNILDLQFLPLGGTFGFDSDVNYTRGQIQASYFNGNIYNNYYRVNEQIFYSPTNNSIVGLEFGFALTKSHYSGGGDSKYTHKGFSDITLSYKHRVLNQSTSGSNLDLRLAVSPKLANSKAAESDKDGNQLRGNTSVQLEAIWGKKIENHHFTLNPSVTWFSDSTTEYSDGDTSEIKSLINYDLTFNYQYDLSDNQAISPYIKLNWKGKSINKADDQVYSNIGLHPSLGLRYKLALNESMRISFYTSYFQYKSTPRDSYARDYLNYSLGTNFVVLF